MGKESLRTAFHVTYNNVMDSTVGVHVSTRPDIPAAREVITTYTIPGRDGSLTIKDGTVEDIVIVVEFSFSAYPDGWQNVYQAARNWLLRRSNAKLKFSDLTGIFYKVKHVEVSAASRTLKKTGVFSASFTCDGYQYYDSGLVGISAGTINNSVATSHPIYKITGNGTCTLTVNSKTLQAVIAQNLSVDTDRMMAYRTDNGTVMNTALIMGNYEYKDFWLVPGSNSVSITSGYGLEIIPNWRRI